MAWLLAILSFGALLVLAMYNPEWVTVKFLFWQTSLPLVGLVLASAALGGLMVGAYALVRSFGPAKKRREANQRIRELEQELVRAREQARHLEQEVARLRSGGRGESPSVASGASAAGESRE